MATKAKEKAKVQEAPATGKIVPKEIRITLTAQQIAERSKRVSQIDAEDTEAEAKFKEEKEAWKQRQAQHKAHMKNLTDSRKKLNEEVRSGVAVTTENTLLHINHEAGVAEYWYPVKGPSEIKEVRPLEDAERQLSMVEEKVKNMPEAGQEIRE